MMVSARPESRMKAAVIDRLFDGKHVDSDSVLISEMVVANWSRRADIVLANGKLWAFEIKSEADTLVRLKGQLESFSYHFEKLVLVVAERFEQQARSMIGEGVGLWIEEKNGALVERVRPKAMPLEKDAAIRLMTASELRRLLLCNGLTDAKDALRERLEVLAQGLPASDLANAARDAIKRRHRGRHEAFLKKRRANGTVAAIKAFRRSGRARTASAPTETEVLLPEVRLTADNPALFQAPAGLVLRRMR